MAFIKLANHTDSIEMTAFPETFRDNQDLLKPQACIAVKGELNIRNGEPTILINRVRAMERKAKAKQTAPEADTVSEPKDNYA